MAATETARALRVSPAATVGLRELAAVAVVAALQRPAPAAMAATRRRVVTVARVATAAPEQRAAPVVLAVNPERREPAAEAASSAPAAQQSRW
jgi:hypothetical protein